MAEDDKALYIENIKAGRSILERGDLVRRMSSITAEIQQSLQVLSILNNKAEDLTDKARLEMTDALLEGGASYPKKV